MMDRNFDYFKYILPAEPVQTYIKNAIATLTDIKSSFPQFYKHFICPSEVLTLSGVRAFDTFYELGKEADRKDIDGIKELLKSHDVMLVEDIYEIANHRNEDNLYSLVNTSALLDIPKHYTHLPPPGWTPPNLKAMDKDADFYLWWFIWQFAIAGNRDPEPPLSDWFKKDHMAFHDITFGILLGYPGEAICSALYETEQDYDEGRVLQANISNAALFEGARPIYNYLRDVADNPHIKNHEKLWSNILKGVYETLEPDAIVR